MASKHKKRYSASFVIRELQIKIMTYHYTLIRITKIQTNDDYKCWVGMWINENPNYIAGRSTKTVQPLWKTIWLFLTKLNILLQCNPAIKILSIYSNKLKTYVHRKTCIIYSSFIHRDQNIEVSDSFIGERIKELWYRQWNIVRR